MIIFPNILPYICLTSVFFTSYFYAADNKISITYHDHHGRNIVRLIHKEDIIESPGIIAYEIGQRECSFRIPLPKKCPFTDEEIHISCMPIACFSQVKKNNHPRSILDLFNWAGTYTKKCTTTQSVYTSPLITQHDVVTILAWISLVQKITISREPLEKEGEAFFKQMQVQKNSIDISLIDIAKILDAAKILL